MSDQNQNRRDLPERLFRFAVHVIKATRTLPKTPEYKVIVYQLVKASTSAGANYEESQAAVSTADFANKVGIALKEMRESHYWIRIIIATLEQHAIWLPLEKEADELKRILGSIYSKSSKKR
jgi:four helix bundle protein